jgi:cytochrome c oxidase subunit II
VDSEKLDELTGFDFPLLISNGLIRFLLTSRDVLHSLGLPSFGVKLDSNPGRLNSTSIDISSKVLLIGSCYELCGAGHRAIPIFILLY